MSQVKLWSWGPLPKVTWAEMAREKYLSAMALEPLVDLLLQRLAGVDLMTGDPDVHHRSPMLDSGAALGPRPALRVNRARAAEPVPDRI